MSKRRPSGDGMVRKREDGRWEVRMTLAQWLERWLDKYAAPRLRESTMSGYRIFQTISTRFPG